ncbi:hypothetical protein L6452_37065 [Arctium lappa]|uniref:Uncharacterized protein n=1 Tax=Arctium lappa TaxID=4217 RepID=A0ACB8Y2H2_ARCLA|nr:hypothetical protein L6452_37065 [Arctium lappa]
MKMNAEDRLHRSGGCWMENTVGEDHRRRRVGRRISGFEAIEPTPPDFLGYGRWKGMLKVDIWKQNGGGEVATCRERSQGKVWTVVATGEQW